MYEVQECKAEKFTGEKNPTRVLNMIQQYPQMHRGQQFLCAT